jgi:hypothetical protein
MKFSGREACILRSIDMANGTIGADILLRTRMEAQEALDILNGMLDMGFLEINPSQQTHVTRWAFNTTMFEVNPAFAHDLKKALIRKCTASAD